MFNILVFVSKYCHYNKRVIRTTVYTKVIERLAFWILTSNEVAPHVINMPGTQAVFADILQTSRSTLNQELQKLREAGAISVKGAQITIHYREYLEMIIGDA